MCISLISHIIIKKSVCIKIGPHWNRPIEPMCLGKVCLDWVNSFKYLGIFFNSGSTLKADINHIKRKFYTACNRILSHCSCADDFVRLELVVAYCSSLLNYCLGSFYLSASKVKDLAVCWNDCFRGIFGFKRYESVKGLHFLWRTAFEYIYDLQKWKLITNVSKLQDKLLILYKLQNSVFRPNELCCKYDDNCASLFNVTQAIWNYFARCVC